MHSISNRKLEYLQDTILAVDEGGLIAFLQSDVNVQDIEAILEQQHWEDVEVIKLTRGEFLIPGSVSSANQASCTYVMLMEPLLKFH